MLVHKSRLPIKEILLYGLLPSPLKVLAYRLRGARIRKGVSIGIGSVLIGDDIEVGDGTQIGHATILRARKLRLGRFVKIGTTTMIDTEHVDIDDDAKINEQVFVGGPTLPESSLKVGKRTIIMQMSFINPTRPIVIGDDTGIGGHCLLFTHGSWQPKTDGYPVTFAPITLGKNVWLPWRVFVMPGVTIGDGSTIGANSLVNKDIPEGSLAAGNPAKVLRGPDRYPRRLDDAARHEMIREMLEEYLGFLRYHDIEVDALGTGPLRLRITRTERGLLRRRRQGYHLVYVGPGETADISKVDGRTFYLSLEAIPADVRARLEAAGAMWVDIAAKRRWGSNDAGEETVLFLSRYGLRFDRAD